MYKEGEGDIMDGKFQYPVFMKLSHPRRPYPVPKKSPPSQNQPHKHPASIENLLWHLKPQSLNVVVVLGPFQTLKKPHPLESLFGKGKTHQKEKSPGLGVSLLSS